MPILHSLLAKYRPDLLHLPSANGAKTIDLEWVQVHPTGLVKPDDPDAKIKFLAGEALRGVGGLVFDARLRALENVIVQHERTIHMLEDRCSLVILVRETIHQQKSQEYRDLHRRRGDEIQKKDHAALHATHKASHTPPGRTAHPLGSQRSLLLTYVWRRQIRKALPR